MSPKSISDSTLRSDIATKRASAPRVTMKEKCRRAVASGLYHTGLLSVLRSFESGHELSASKLSRLPRLRRTGTSKFGILCYHRVGTEGVPIFSRLKPAIFERQMHYLKKNYRIVPLGQLCLELQDRSPVPPTLAITFDDGYRDLYTHAFPVLRKYSIPATIYLIGRCMQTGETPWYDRIFVALQSASGPVLQVDLGESREFAISDTAARAAVAWEIVCYLRSIPDLQRRKWCAEFDQRMRPPAEQLKERMLNWGQVRIMQNGGVSFAAHTMTHPSVGRLDSSALHEELVRSREELEAGLQTSIEDFAYPFGKPADCSIAAEEVLSRAGYRSAVTTTSGRIIPGANPFRLFRMQISDDPSMPSFAFNLARMLMDGDPVLQNEIQDVAASGGSAVLHQKNTVGL